MYLCMNLLFVSWALEAVFTSSVITVASCAFAHYTVVVFVHVFVNIRIGHCCSVLILQSPIWYYNLDRGLRSTERHNGSCFENAPVSTSTHDVPHVRPIDVFWWILCLRLVGLIIISVQCTCTQIYVSSKLLLGLC